MKRRRDFGYDFETHENRENKDRQAGDTDADAGAYAEIYQLMRHFADISVDKALPIQLTNDDADLWYEHFSGTLLRFGLRCNLPEPRVFKCGSEDELAIAAERSVSHILPDSLLQPAFQFRRQA